MRVSGQFCMYVVRHAGRCRLGKLTGSELMSPLSHDRLIINVIWTYMQTRGIPSVLSSYRFQEYFGPSLNVAFELTYAGADH